MKLGVNVNSLLPNVRWLCLQSESMGQDWYEKSLEIDALIAEEGLDLSEESVFLLYSNPPEEVLDGLGECLIARPVIGPKKKFKAPFELIDWKALPVYRTAVSGDTLTQLLERASKAREAAMEGSKAYAGDFILCVGRKLKGELILSVEAIFHE